MRNVAAAIIACAAIVISGHPAVAADGGASITRQYGVAGLSVQAHAFAEPTTPTPATRSPAAGSRAAAPPPPLAQAAAPSPAAPVVFTRACAATHTSSGAIIDYAYATTTESCLLASLAPPPDAGPKKKRHGKPAAPSPEELGRAAVDRAISLAPRPRLRVAPRAIGLTGLPSYFWLAERPHAITATAGVPGLTVTAEATPVQFVWRFGDGTQKATTASGRRWRPRSPGNIAHVYETRGRYRAAVEVVWEARWRIGSGPWRPLGYFSNSDARRYGVRQVVGVLVPPR